MPDADVVRAYVDVTCVIFMQHDVKTAMNGAWFDMSVDLESPVPLFVRAGFIIPTQTPASNTKLRSGNLIYYSIGHLHS